MSGKECLNIMIGKSGLIDGAMAYRTVRRAQNSIKRWNDKDYDEDWCKLKGWAREYMERNRQSRCEVITDEENRCGPHMMCLHGPRA